MLLKEGLFSPGAGTFGPITAEDRSCGIRCIALIGGQHSDCRRHPRVWKTAPTTRPAHQTFSGLEAQDPGRILN